MVLLGKLHELSCARLVVEPEPLLAYARADLNTSGGVLQWRRCTVEGKRTSWIVRVTTIGFIYILESTSY